MISGIAPSVAPGGSAGQPDNSLADPAGALDRWPPWRRDFFRKQLRLLSDRTVKSDPPRSLLAVTVPDCTTVRTPRRPQTQGGSREATRSRSPRLSRRRLSVRPRAAATTPNDRHRQRSTATGKTIKVWLMVDAESGWKDVVDAGERALQGGDQARRQGRVPAVGQPLHPPRHRPGRHRRRRTSSSSATPTCRSTSSTARSPRSTRRKFENSSTWLTGLSDPCTLDGKRLLRALLRRRPGADLPHRPARRSRPQAARRPTPSCSPRPTS